MADNYITVTLDGTEQEVYTGGCNCDIRNDGTDTVYLSPEAEVVPDAKGVLSVPAGQAAKYIGLHGRAHLLGTGKVLLCGNDYADQVFKVAATSSGGGGTDEVARQAISSHANNADIHYTDEKAITAAGTTLTNPNLLINSDFCINQRGQMEYTATGSTLDRWYISDKAAVSVNDGYITLTKQDPSVRVEMIQKLELPYSALAGKDVTISVILSDDTTVTATGTIPETQPSTTTAFINAKDFVIRFLWSVGGYYFFSIFIHDVLGTTLSVKKVKLELGTISTIENDVCDKATELAKCQRYVQAVVGGVQATLYRIIPSGLSFFYPTPVTMKSAPTCTAEFAITTGANNTQQEGFTFEYYHKPNGIIIEAQKANHGLTWDDAPLLACISSGVFSAES